MNVASNRRRHQRQPISLSALVHPPEGRSWLCVIRDFCEAGMLLAGSGSGVVPRKGLGMGQGEEIALHFSVPTPEGQQHYRTTAAVARVVDGGNGVGVHFGEGMPSDAFDQLLKYAVASGLASDPDAEIVVEEDDLVLEEAAEQQRKAAPGSDTQERAFRDQRIAPSDAKRIKDQLGLVMQRATKSIGSRFFELAAEELLVKARDAGTNALQMMYFEGMDALEKHQNDIQKHFSDSVLAQIREVTGLEQVLERRRRRDSGDGPTKLEIVDTDEFEEWLAIAEIINKAEARYNDQLIDIRAQLGLIAKPWSHKDAVPVGPAVLAWAFDDALHDLDFRRQVRQDVFKCLERAMLAVLGNLYGSIAQLLEESRAFPSIEELRAAVQRRSIRRSASGVRIDPDAYKDMDAAVREAAMAADGVAPRAATDFNPFIDEAPSSAQVYNTARELMGIERRTRSLLGKPAEPMLAASDARPEETFNTTDILSALSIIQQEQGDLSVSDVRLKARVLEVLSQQHGDQKGFREDDYDTLDVMDNLVESLTADKLITEGIRSWIKRLELTLVKLATQDPEFLRNEEARPHSAVQMLNQLARLGGTQDVREGIDRNVGQRVEELLERVVSEYDRNPEVIEEVVSELNPLIDEQTKTYRGNIERTVRASEGHQKLARARRTVLAELTERYAGEQVPQLVVQLVNPGWRNLLVHAHLRHGGESNEWLDAWSLLDQLSGQLSGAITADSPGYVDPNVVLKRIKEGLDGISFDPAKRTPLIIRLSDALVGDTTGERAGVELVDVAAGKVAEIFGLDGLLPELDPQIEGADETVRESWERALERARRVHVGEWLAMTDDKGRPLILSVAFVGDEASFFVLVNRKGIKARELDLKAMADGLHQGQITLLDDFDMPLMERASQRMLETMHNQLTYQASHDELTELLNRKEFERRVETALASAKNGVDQHALLFVDLDQFKIVNNTSGHTAGDRLLKDVGESLTHVLADLPAHVARLGGDEFGVLLEDSATDDARATAERVLQTIRDSRFEWEGRRFNTTASIGLVFIDRTTDSVDAAMQFADEACYSAKDAGRNRVQEYELGDARMMERRGVMEWVGQLDRALDENRLILNCQRIAPVDGDGLDHYEVLLSMRDEFGDVMPPSDFIHAAETYNRMAAIDRWVIEHVLAWMAEHRGRLDAFGGFSINVSGHSINDETFPDFVLDQFTKSQAPTAKVCFEITETAAIANLDNANDFMNRMKIIGCQFSLDDFGTGLSSYSYLRNLPVDYVKIDGVFVRDIVSSPGDYAVVRSINEIGHYMGKRTIAEYVENDAVLEQLREIGVDFAQGYGIAKPKLLAELL